MNRKKLLLFVIVPVSAVASLGCGFLMATLFAPAPPAAEPNQMTARNAAEQLPELGLGATRTVPSEVQQQRRARQNKLTQDLKDAMRDMNDKRQEYEKKTRDLQKEEERIAEVREAAQEDFQRLDDMRIDIANALTNLKKEKQSLEDGKIRVKKEENANLKVMAGVLSTMKANNAATWIATMSEQAEGQDPRVRLGIDEAAAHIYMMQPKAQAKLFDALIKDKKAALAANLGRRIKSIKLEQ